MDGFSGLRILIVEDESLVIMLIEDTLADFGCHVVDVAADLGEAMNKASSLEFDGAILDVNLGGQKTFDVAEILSRRGIPFVFSTGYGTAGLPHDFRPVPVLTKPFLASELKEVLAHLAKGRRA